MHVYFIESVILIRWDRFDEQKQLIRWTVISVLVVYDHFAEMKTGESEVYGKKYWDIFYLMNFKCLFMFDFQI